MNCQAASGTVRKHLIAERSLRAGVLIKGFVQEEGGWTSCRETTTHGHVEDRKGLCVCACVCAAHDCDPITKNNIGRGIIETSAVCVQWKESGKKEGKMEGKEEEGEET